MRNFYLILVVSITLFSCNRINSEKEWVVIKNTRSIADYQNYLVKYPQTSHLSEIIDSLRIFQERKYFSDDWPYDCFGNCLSLLINVNGQLLFESKLVNINDLKEEIKYSISNPKDLPELPEKKLVSVFGLGDLYVSKGVIDIKSDKNLDPIKYSGIIILVKEGFLDLQNEYSLKLYGQLLSKISSKQKNIIETIVPISIRFERYAPGPPLPPRHSESSENQ